MMAFLADQSVMLRVIITALPSPIWVNAADCVD